MKADFTAAAPIQDYAQDCQDCAQHRAEPAKPHALELEVRDYECDHQGIVNHAVYLNYLEHARHKVFERHFGISALSTQGIYLVVAEIQMRYLRPLRPQDRFVVYSSFALQGQFRLHFEQSIAKTAQTGTGKRTGKAKNEDVLRANICVAAVENGRPCPFARVSQICGYAF